MRSGDGGKSDARRNEDRKAVERNWDDIDWNAREREQECTESSKRST